MTDAHSWLRLGLRADPECPETRRARQNAEYCTAHHTHDPVQATRVWGIPLGAIWTWTAILPLLFVRMAAIRVRDNGEARSRSRQLPVVPGNVC